MWKIDINPYHVYHSLFSILTMKESKSVPTTFVSCIFDETKYDESSLIRFAKTDIPIILFTCPTIYDIVKHIIDSDDKLYHAICIRPLLPPLWKELHFKDFWVQGLSLPSTRNEEKDTIAHMWNMHSKVQYLNEAVRENPHKSQNFAWIDFDVKHMFHKDETWNMLRTQFGVSGDSEKHLHMPLALQKGSALEPVYGLNIALQNHIWVPGCVDKLSTEQVDSFDFKHHVHWRFCGSFLLGSGQAIKRLYQLYKNQFRIFLVGEENREKNGGAHNVLSWEVNFWAWLEAHDFWNPKWYRANHDDSLIDIPDMYSFHVAQDCVEFTKYKYPYVDLSPFRPGSASYIAYRGKEYLNTRYVNYWIYHLGGYWYPEDEHVLRTKNVLSELVSGCMKPYQDEEEQYEPLPPMTYDEDDIKQAILIPSGFQEIHEDLVQNKRHNVFSEGIEDLRLFESVSDMRTDDCEVGLLKCIGTTCSYSHNERVRMILGTYDLEEKCIKDCITIDPPEGCDTWVEKNWAPIPWKQNGVKADAFIYKWHPLEIGIVEKTDDELIGQLHIVCKQSTPGTVFHDLKGSTPFIPHHYEDEHGETIEGYIGLIHGHEDTTPRQYFHRMVFLEKETYKVKRYTDAFCFIKPSIEFCIGMKYHDERNVWVFWISQMDRDATMVEIPDTWFDNKWVRND